MFDDPKDKFMGTSTDDDLDSSGDTTKVGLVRERWINNRDLLEVFQNTPPLSWELSFRC